MFLIKYTSTLDFFLSIVKNGKMLYLLKSFKVFKDLNAYL